MEGGTQAQHSVDVDAPRDVAWRFWTDVANWAVDPQIERVHLDGPFRAGARGETALRGDAPPVPWDVVEVDEGIAAVILIAAGAASSRFTWRFEDLPGGRTRLTQRVSVHGAPPAVARELTDGLPAGMARLAAAIERHVSGA